MQRIKSKQVRVLICQKCGHGGLRVRHFGGRNERWDYTPPITMCVNMHECGRWPDSHEYLGEYFRKEAI